jgi:hypothetical protein
MDNIMTWLVALVGLISNLVTGLITWTQARSQQERTISSLRNELDVLTEKHETVVSDLQQTKAAAEETRKVADRYGLVRQKLQASTVVRRYLQPVVLLGPRHVGKTSLLKQWHSPWDHGRLDPTARHRMVEVPIYDHPGDDAEPHFADESIRVPVEKHLVLKVHDFPGEPHLQKKVREVAERETQELREQTGKNLGLVLVCMFDAEEAHTGISTETSKYYNGDLFRELRALVTFRKVSIERLILVFNKYDLLRSRIGHDVSEEVLLQSCLDRFEEIFKLLSGACHSDRVCECFTVLGREDLMPKSQGATIVLGEASRHFVTALVSPQAATEVARFQATRFASTHF